MLLTGGYATLRSSSVQTWLVNEITGYVHSKYNVEMRITGVDLDFFDRLVLENVYVEDHKKDTLIYIEHLSADINLIATDSMHFSLDAVVLDRALFHMRTYKGETKSNLDYFIDAFSTEDDEQSSSDYQIDCSAIAFSDSEVIIEDQNADTNLISFDYNRIVISDINGVIESVNIDNDSISAHLEHLRFKERSGFRIDDVSANIGISPLGIVVEDLTLQTNHSTIALDLALKTDKYEDYADFIDKVDMNIQFRRTEIELGDIAFFTSELEGIQHKIYIDGHMHGKVKRLKGDGLNIQFASHSYLKGDIDLTGLPDMDHTLIQIAVTDFKATQGDLKRIPVPPFSNENYLKLPKNVANLGNIDFKGMFTGYVHDFRAYGDLETSVGDLEMDVAILVDTNGTVRYKGDVATEGFALGRFIDNRETIGNIALHCSADGHITKNDEIDMVLDGNIEVLELLGYNYHNVNIDGHMANDLFEGLLGMSDPNLDFDFKGTIDFSKKVPEFDFNTRVNKLKPYQLNLSKRDSLSLLSFNADFGFKGLRIEDMEGDIFLSEVKYREFGKELNIEGVRVNAVKQKGGYINFDLISDVVDVHIAGVYRTTDLLRSIQKVGGSVTKTMGIEKELKSITEVDFELDVHSPEAVLDMFLPEGA